MIERIQQQGKSRCIELLPLFEKWKNIESLELSAETETAISAIQEIKGNFAFLNFTNIRNLSHALEGRIREIHDGICNLDLAMANQLYDATAELSQMIDNILRSEERDISDLLESLHFSGVSALSPDSDGFDDYIWPLEPSQRQIQRAFMENTNIYRITLHMKEDLDKKNTTILDMNQLLMQQGSILSVGLDTEPVQGLDNCLSIDLKFQILLQSVNNIQTLSRGLNLNKSRFELLDLPKFLPSHLATKAIQNEMNTDTEALVPLEENTILRLFQNMGSLINDLAERCKKEIHLDLRCDPCYLNETYRRSIQQVLIQLLRNALDHGIELPSDRLRANKDPVGTISIDNIVRNDILTIHIRDDGRGLDSKEIYARAKELGLDNDEDSDIREIICLPDFSTQEEVSSLSGTGQGLNLVCTEVTLLDGEIQIESDEGEGTSIKLTFPLPR